MILKEKWNSSSQVTSTACKFILLIKESAETGNNHHLQKKDWVFLPIKYNKLIHGTEVLLLSQ